MTISLSEVCKRFNRDWIFQKFSYNFTSGHSYAITGPNGSGKSTLLQVIGGAVAMSEGEIKYEVRSTRLESGIQNQESPIRNIPADHAFKYISIAAPYLEVIEEMTAVELLEFHHKFKPLLPGSTIPRILSIVGLEAAAKKQIRYYSSGMKQRIKLAQAIFSNTPVVLLDEPCTNLDTEGIELYQQLIRDYCSDRLIIVSSNDIQEYGFCEEKISIVEYKR
ncbi:MAG: ATP-binding cassette domain-containing protein [Chitinophagaceae bacterium]|nr:ATP-binding cassette domain-containing protein [Chitinophagaceae bacterium]